ncbi:hypothetical protein GCK72_012157 [Caenorhabditis remanei]|uniref:Major sperm protein n=1 Tax=Caenorhabditis remanei TaxID=31234 RepID=A0A6A5GK69_CAERE|nr:hypothetical protein GCK72_012157 [Caenorhabditis remanei]KAF1755707.1 hypothetical protein GCK72_012157 [Caenorhabditis remanei]
MLGSWAVWFGPLARWLVGGFLDGMVARIPRLGALDPVITLGSGSRTNSLELLEPGIWLRGSGKIKSSNNTEYRITPVFGFIDGSGTKDVVVTRTAGGPKEDKLVIHFAPAPADATDAQAAFATVTPAGTITIPLSAQ